ncbi:MAG: VCBS repeat-containing protein, partial [Acidobacteria bacterium]|nr:VCBS repeat-containing protein [Acidobacteriota bacterium]
MRNRRQPTTSRRSLRSFPRFKQLALASLCLCALACVLTYTRTSYALVTNYSFTATSGNFTPLTGATTVSLSGGTLDEGYYNNVPIGFTFNYDAQPYTSISASTNGWMVFNQALSNANSFNDLTSSTPRPIIAPLWDNLKIDATGSFSYLTEGVAGSRVFTAQWLNVVWNTGAAGPTNSFQVKLYEATGEVQFVYRQEAAAANSGSASIGITSSGTGAGNYLSLNGTGASPTASSAAETTNLSTKPATGQIYTFSPPGNAPAPPTGLSFSGVTLSSVNVNWVDDSTNESLFIVYQSTDGLNFSEAGRVNTTSQATTGTPYALNVTGLSSSTSYTFRVVAATEGLLSTALEGTQATQAGTISGLKSIGPAPSDYASIKAAFTDIQTNGLSGPVILELKSTYTSEPTYPLVVGFMAASAVNNITIRPAVGAVGLTLNTAITTTTIDFNGGKYVTFDGRPGGVGTGKELIFENSTSSASVVRFMNEGSYNTIKYCIIRGFNNSATNGLVFFSTTTGTQGNDNNTISNCDIRDSSGGQPRNAIYASGSGTNEAQYNSGNVIADNNIFNFYQSISSFAGIRISSGNTGWTISGNSIYQTSVRTPASGNPHYGITINASFGNNFIVTQNYIGGTAPNAGSTAFTINGSSAHRFTAIEMSVGSGVASSVQGNVITNINLTSTSSGALMPIIISGGNVNCGNVTGNTIGGGTGTGALVVTSTSSSGSTTAINSTTSGTVNISNNIIGSITANSSAATTAAGVVGILVTNAANAVINNNVIGSTTTANSLNATNASTSGNAQNVTGIVSGSNGVVSITGNTIVNLNNNATGSVGASQTAGILAQSSTSGNTITGNTIRKLSNAATQLNTDVTAPVIGIVQSSSAAGQNVSQNIIADLSSTAASAAVTMHGIYYNGPSSGTNVIGRNLVYNLTSASTGAAVINGIQAAGGIANYQNNMVRLGTDATAANLSLAGIRDRSFANNNYYHNSVYLGGTTSGAGSAASYAFQRVGSTGVCNVINNILVNMRDNGTGTGKHYNIQTASTSAFTANYNDYYRAGSGMALGGVGATDYLDFNAWKSGSTQDASSKFGDPSFVGATSSVPDLHINPGTECSPVPGINGAGQVLAAVTSDFDSDARTTAPDIGADEITVNRAVTTGCALSSGRYDNLTINPAGATLASSINVDGTLTLGGMLDAGSSVLTVGCAGAISGASSSAYVIGNLRKDFCGPAAFTFEVGTANGYSPVAANVTSVAVNPSGLTVKASQGVATATPPLNASQTLQRYWTLTEAGNLTTNLTFNYLDPTDIAGNESNYRLFRITGGTATNFPPPAAVVDTSANTATINGVTDFSDWTLGEPLAPTSSTANISGHVLGSSGQPLAGVTMTLLDTVLVQNRTAVTDGNGFYHFDAIVTGRDFVVTPARTGYLFNPQSRAFTHLFDLNSVDFTAARDPFVPRPALNDYDGDGKAELSVFRPADGTWYIQSSSNGVMRADQWGTSGDKIVPADYDGDGRTDLAVFRPSNGTWYILQSNTNSLRAVQWGISTDVVAPADYDGDGRADVAVWREATGTWYV